MRLLIDTDTAADDAVAILMALQTPGVDVAALTTVSGNVTLEQATANALQVLHVCGRPDIAVHAGASAPLARAAAFATEVHGPDGFGAQWYPPVGELTSNDAVAASLEVIGDNPGEVTWVALGPLTNLALAVEADPAVCRQAKEVIVMGGTGDGVGNVTPYAEFNFWADPEAAQIVLDAGLPIRLVGCDVARRHGFLTERDREALRSSSTPLGEFAFAVTTGLWAFCMSKGYDDMDLCDPVAMAAALAPGAATWQPTAATVDCSEERRGALTLDTLPDHRPNAELCTSYDLGRFRTMLFEAVGAV